MSALDTTRLDAPASVGRLQTIGLGVGLVGLALSAIGWFVAPEQFFFSWLLAVSLVVTPSIGCLALLMIHHLTGGAWGTVARRVWEAGAGLLPLLFLFALPLLLGLDVLYEWARPEAANDPLLVHKSAYLNESGFAWRMVVYFVIWSGLAFWLRRLSHRQDQAPDPNLSKRMAAISAPGLVIWALVTTFAYMDWLMSLEAHWFSTIYGVYFFGGSGLAALAVTILVSVRLRRDEPMTGALAPRHFHDWGKLLFAFVLLWTYFGVSQFLIIWAANLPEEIVWYLHRTRHGWGYVGVALAIFHFAVPFALLLSRDLKKNAGRLAWVAGFLLVMRWLDHLWQIAPVAHPDQFVIHWLDVAAPAALVGLWLAGFCFLLRRHPILPANDPYLEEAYGDESH